MRLEAVKTAVLHLSSEELARFSVWLQNYIADQWDRQIESDVAAGRLDTAGSKADADFDAGNCTAL
jgi:hypothetical protein